MLYGDAPVYVDAEQRSGLSVLVFCEHSPSRKLQRNFREVGASRKVSLYAEQSDRRSILETLSPKTLVAWPKKLSVSPEFTNPLPACMRCAMSTLTIEPEKIHCLVGENGCGKSTLIKMIAGVYERDAGDSRHQRQGRMNGCTPSMPSAKASRSSIRISRSFPT